jgi:hypothetical protein
MVLAQIPSESRWVLKKTMKSSINNFHKKCGLDGNGPKQTIIHYVSLKQILTRITITLKGEK